METNPKQALLVVDVRNFCPGGALAIEDGAAGAEIVSTDYAD